MTSIKDLYWLAGFLDGEGYFGSSGKRKSSPLISVSQKGRELLDRLVILLKHGKVYTCKDKFAYYCTGRRSIEVMMTIFPLMSEKRRSEIKRTIKSWKEAPGETWILRENACRNGHLYTEENTLRNVRGLKLQKYCKICKHIRDGKTRKVYKMQKIKIAIKALPNPIKDAEELLRKGLIGKMNLFLWCPKREHRQNVILCKYYACKKRNKCEEYQELKREIEEAVNKIEREEKL